MDPFDLFIIAIVAMLTLTLGIIFFVVLYQRRVIHHQEDLKILNEQKQHELISASIQGEENERTRIAAELHDDVGATLSSVRLYLHSASKKPDDKEFMNETRELLDDSINKVRNISHMLQPSTLQRLGLQTALISFSEIIDRSGKIRMVYLGGTPLPRMEEKIELAVYRVVQEITNNTIKHSGASKITIATKLETSVFKVFIEHNGDGLSDAMFEELLYKTGATGLKNIVNRLQTIRAQVNFSGEANRNYKITITAPVSI